MATTYPQLNEKLIAFIRRQKMFFVATAPLAAEGSVNVSPKGYDSLAILDETHRRLSGPGRIGDRDARPCARERTHHPDVLRLRGRRQHRAGLWAGRIHGVRSSRVSLRSWRMFPGFTRARGVITMRITRVTDSCGWAVPFFDYRGERDQLRRWVDAAEDDAWAEKRYASNAHSIDGLPGLVRAAER